MVPSDEVAALSDLFLTLVAASPLVERRAVNEDEEEYHVRNEDEEMADEKLIKRWKEQGFEFVDVRHVEEDFTDNLELNESRHQQTQQKKGEGKRNIKSMVKMMGIGSGGGAAASKMSSIAQRASKAGHDKKKQRGKGKDDNGGKLLLDSSKEYDLLKKLKRWSEDALETESLTCFELGELWTQVEHMCSRDEEHLVDKELARLETEGKVLEAVKQGVRKVYGVEEEEVLVTGEQAFEKWKDKLDLSVLESGSGSDMSSSLFSLQKEVSEE